MRLKHGCKCYHLFQIIRADNLSCITSTKSMTLASNNSSLLTIGMDPVSHHRLDRELRFHDARKEWFLDLLV